MEIEIVINLQSAHSQRDEMKEATSESFAVQGTHGVLRCSTQDNEYC